MKYKEKTLFIIFAIICITLFLLLFNNKKSQNKESENNSINASNQFTFNLYSKYLIEEENILFSPYSLSSAFVMVYEGAKGETAEEIQSVLNFQKEDNIRRKQFAEDYKKFNDEDKKYELNIANAIWIQKNYKLLNSYLEIIKDYYSGQIENLDFSNKEKSRLTVNNWVSKKTKEKIKELLPKGSINPDTKLILTNAIYFKANWLKTLQ